MNRCLLKLALLTAVLLLGRPSESRAAWIVETPLEFITQGDFDADGRSDVIVLDKETGTGRAGFQEIAGELSWQPGFASGIANATSLAVGRITSSSADAIAVTAPHANRINKLSPGDLDSPSGIKPVAIYPPGIGPNLISAIDIGGAGNTALDDFFLTTTQNPSARYGLLRNTGSAVTLLGEDALPRSLSSPNAFAAKSGQPLWLGAIAKIGRSGLTNRFYLFDFSTGAMVTRLEFAPPLGDIHFAAAQFAPDNPLAQVLFYSPGTSDVIKFQIRESSGVFSLSTSNRFRLGSNLQFVQPVPHDDTSRLLAFFGPEKTNLTSAVIYDFDGVNAPRAVQTWNGNFTGAALLGNGNFALLQSDAAGRSSAHQVILDNGSNYRLGSSGTLPLLNRFSGSANALLFDAEPFVNASARPRQAYRHADWTTSLQVTPTVRVTGQQFTQSSVGLAGSSSRDFGAPANGVTAGLVNQYFPSISVFSGRDAVGVIEAEVKIDPPAGHYGEAQKIRLSISSGWQIYYRTSSSQPWSPYTAPFLLIANANVQYYARRIADQVPTPIGQASYTFSQPLDTLDSDNDGVPDFVEQAKGLDPLAGPDSDQDGFTDLEELASGTNPLSAGSKPSSNASLGNAFNRLVSPRPPAALSGDNTTPALGVALRTFNLGGSFLGLAETSSVQGAGTTNPAALFLSLVPAAGSSLVVETTPEHFGTGLLKIKTGRELIGLVPVPQTNNLTVNYSMGNGSLAAEAANWIEAASAALISAKGQTIAGLLTVEDSLVAALFERHSVNGMISRGQMTASNATLFPFRPGDSGRIEITSANLRELERYISPAAPGFLQQTVYSFLAGQVDAKGSASILSDLARELWRISAAENNQNEGDFPLPFDELRKLLAGEPLTPAYLSFPSISTNLPKARAQAAALLAAIPERPRINATLTVVSSTDGSIQLVNSGGTPVRLRQFEGEQFVFPPNLQLLPGSRISVFAHTDLVAPAGELFWEVISIGLVAVPMPSPSDLDGNLLVDSWEELFFGHQGEDPFADWDGDGFSNLQEMLAGTQPNDSLGVPVGQPVDLLEPELVLETGGAQLKFYFEWPENLAGRFKFELQSSDDAAGPYITETTPPITPIGDNIHEITLPQDSSPARFYRMTIQYVE